MKALFFLVFSLKNTVKGTKQPKQTRLSSKHPYFSNRTPDSTLLAVRASLQEKRKGPPKHWYIRLQHLTQPNTCKNGAKRAADQEGFTKKGNTQPRVLGRRKNALSGASECNLCQCHFYFSVITTWNIDAVVLPATCHFGR